MGNTKQPIQILILNHSGGDNESCLLISQCGCEILRGSSKCAIYFHVTTSRHLFLEILLDLVISQNIKELGLPGFLLAAPSVYWYTGWKPGLPLGLKSLPKSPHVYPHWYDICLIEVHWVYKLLWTIVQQCIVFAYWIYFIMGNFYLLDS